MRDTERPSSGERTPLVVPMRPRSPREEHRAATPLELFFDLVFVVAVAQAAEALHHAVAEGHAAAGVVGYVTVFFAIWWAWMNFTWFASAYGTDDVPYRLLVLLQMAGALALAAGVPAAAGELDFRLVTWGYVVMRVAMVSQWLRAAAADPPRRRTALRYALGIAVCQLGWVGLLALPPERWLAGFAVLAPAELLVPVWAERAGATTWHPRHIAERYGLFTIIVLGETILASSMAIRTAIDAGAGLAALAPVIVGGILTVFGLWWLYFARPVDDLRVSLPRMFLWGYGHLVIFASAAAIGAGLAVAVDREVGLARIGHAAAGAAVAAPAALFLLSLWALHVRLRPGALVRILLMPVFAALVLFTPLVGEPVLATGLLVAALVAAKLATRDQALPDTGR